MENKTIFKKIIKWLCFCIFLITASYFLFNAILGFFIGPMVFEVRNGLEQAVIIEKIQIQKCQSCNPIDFNLPAKTVSPNVREFLEIHESMQDAIISLTIKIGRDASAVRTCQIKIKSRSCHSTIYIRENDLICDSCEKF